MDRREEILARLLALAQNVTGFKIAVRNKNEFSDLARPALVVLDGDEAAQEKDPQARPTNAPRIIHMKPEVIILMSGTPDAIGTSVNGQRAKLIKAIEADAALLALVWDGAKRQSIRYEGSGLAIASGRQIEADMTLHFVLTYVLRPDEL
jgi:hypothetical protein